MKRFGGWFALVAVLLLGGTYSGVVYHNSVKIGGGYEGGSGLSVQDDGTLLSTSTLKGTQLISTVATGTPPLVAASTTVVPNLYVARAQLADLATRATTADSATTNFDISDDTNLSGGSGIVLTGDALSHSTAAGYKHLPTGGTAGQALTATGTSGTGAWADGSGTDWSYLAQLRIGGTDANAETTIDNAGDFHTYHVTSKDLTVQGAMAYFDLGTTISPFYHVTLTAPTTLTGNTDVSYPTEGGTMVVMPANGSAGNVLLSDGDGTVHWGSSASSASLADVGDVDAYSSITAGDIEIWSGTGWANKALSGDATVASTGAVAVADDSHAHTTTTISGLDVSDDTNLSAGSGIVLTGDALSHSTANGYKHTPADGAANQILQYTSAGTAAWATLGGDITLSGGTATIAANAVVLGTDTTGSYVSSVTVGDGLNGTSGGGEGPALTLGLDFTTAATGDHTLYADYWTPVLGGICFEGHTADTIEGYLICADPTTPDKIWTLPNLTGTVALTGASQNVSFGGVTASSTLGVTGLLSASGGEAVTGLLSAANSAEKITNGTFASDVTGWTGEQRASVTWQSPGTLRVTKTNSDDAIGTGYQLLTNLTVGRRYRLTYTLLAGATGTAYVSAGTATTIPSGSGYRDYVNGVVASVGVNTVYFTATATTFNLQLGTYNGATSGHYTEWDDVSLVEMGDIAVAGNATVTGTVSVARLNSTGGVHVGGTSDPGTDNLIVDGTSTLTGNVDTGGVYQAGSSNVNLTNAAGNLLWAAMETPTIKETIILTAAGGEPTVTAGCSASAAREQTVSGNKRNYRAMDFADGSSTSAFWNVTTLPPDYAGGVFVVKVQFKTPATGAVRWSVAALATSHDDPFVAALGTSCAANCTVTAVDDHLSMSLGDMTAGGSPVAGDDLYVVITRVGADGGDTMAGTAELLGAELSYVPKVN